jgi:HK97 gp10 family phage protein
MAQVKGLDKVLNSLKAYGVKAENGIKAITSATGEEIAADAKTLSPVDNGTLRQSINADIVNNGFTSRIAANAPYAAYQEFGTGGLVSVPKELESIAAQFKGKGIRQINLKPQPFLYPAFVKGRAQYVKDLEALLTKLANQ